MLFVRANTIFFDLNSWTFASVLSLVDHERLVFTPLSLHLHSFSPIYRTLFNMFSTFATLVLSLIATSAVSALVVPRTSAPQGWDTSALEVCQSIPCELWPCVLTPFLSPMTPTTVDMLQSSARPSTTRNSFLTAATPSRLVLRCMS